MNVTGVPIIIHYQSDIIGISYYYSGEHHWDKYNVSFKNIMGVLNESTHKLYIDTNQPIMKSVVTDGIPIIPNYPESKLEKRFGGKPVDKIIYDGYVYDLLNGFEFDDYKYDGECVTFSSFDTKLFDLRREKLKQSSGGVSIRGMGERILISYVIAASYKEIQQHNKPKNIWCETNMYPDIPIDIQVNDVSHQLEFAF